MLVELKGVDTNNGSVEARFNRDFFILFVQTWYIRLLCFFIVLIIQNII